MAAFTSSICITVFCSTGLSDDLFAQSVPFAGTRSTVDLGRIYRVVSDRKANRPPQLGKASAAELVHALAHPNGWVPRYGSAVVD